MKTITSRSLGICMLAASLACGPALSADETEITFWESVRDGDADEIRAYLDAYPDGDFAALARIRLQRVADKPASGSGPEADTAVEPGEPGMSDDDVDRLAEHCLAPGRPDAFGVPAGGVPAFSLVDIGLHVAFCRRALRLDPARVAVETQLARLLVAQRRLEEAERHLARIAVHDVTAAAGVRCELSAVRDIGSVARDDCRRAVDLGTGWALEPWLRAGVHPTEGAAAIASIVERVLEGSGEPGNGSPPPFDRTLWLLVAGTLVEYELLDPDDLSFDLGASIFRVFADQSANANRIRAWLMLRDGERADEGRRLLWQAASKADRVAMRHFMADIALRIRQRQPPYADADPVEVALYEKQGETWLQRALARDEPAASLLNAMSLSLGIGRPPDFDRAVEVLRRTPALGMPADTDAAAADLSTEPGRTRARVRYVQAALLRRGAYTGAVNGIQDEPLQTAFAEWRRSIGMPGAAFDADDAANLLAAMDRLHALRRRHAELDPRLHAEDLFELGDPAAMNRHEAISFE